MKERNHRVIGIEHGSFTPLVFSSYGGCAAETERVVKVIATNIAEKQCMEYGKVINWLRTKISYVLLRNTILCVRGSRGMKRTKLDTTEIEISHEIGNINS